MKIVVAAIGSRGDVQPYLNLCQGLLKAGHDVKLATNPTLGSLAEAHGIPFIPVGPPVDMGVEAARLLARSFDNMWIGMIRVMQLGARLVEEAYPDVLSACREVDLVITTDTGSGVAEAERLGKPWITVTLQPARLPTLPDKPPSFAGRMLWKVIGGLLVGPTNRFRKRVGAPEVEDITTMMSQRMILLPVSPAVAPHNPKWPGHVKQTGYWYARLDENWHPPQDLAQFLKGGERPVVVSLGVMGTSGKKAAQSARIVLEAIRKANVRAILQGWDPDVFKPQGLPRTVYCAGSMPHGWLFDQAALIVHHGGFGTTAAGLRSGVPNVVIPHVIDQYYWGQQVINLGVGPEFLTRGKLTSDRLAARLERGLSDASMRDKAHRLGETIRNEPDGVLQAVRLIESIP